METNPRKSFAFCITITLSGLSGIITVISFFLTVVFILTKKGIISATDPMFGNFIDTFCYQLPHHNEKLFSLKVFIGALIVFVLTLLILKRESKDSENEEVDEK